MSTSSAASLPSPAGSEIRPEQAADLLRSDGVASMARMSKQLREQDAARRGTRADPAQDGLAFLETEHDAIAAAMHHCIDLAQAWWDQQQGMGAGTEVTSGAPEEVDVLVSRMVALILQHASLEERFVYPLFRSHLKGEVEGVSAEAIYERNVMDDNLNKVALDTLMTMKLRRDGRLMLATLKKLDAIESEHMMQEEQWFSLLRRSMSASELSTLASTIRSESASGMAVTRPHSVAGPSRVTAAAVTHPIAGMIDRAADKITGRDAKLAVDDKGTHSAEGVPLTKL